MLAKDAKFLFLIDYIGLYEFKETLSLFDNSHRITLMITGSIIRFHCTRSSSIVARAQRANEFPQKFINVQSQ